MAKYKQLLDTQEEKQEEREETIFSIQKTVESDRLLNQGLEDSANHLLSVLTPSIRGRVIEVADIVLKIPRWQLILGSLIKCQNDGHLQSPFIDPSWVSLESIVRDSICEFCGEKFKPIRYNQKYCSEPCGTESRKKLAEEQKARYLSREFA